MKNQLRERIDEGVPETRQELRLALRALYYRLRSREVSPKEARVRLAFLKERGRELWQGAPLKNKDTHGELMRALENLRETMRRLDGAFEALRARPPRADPDVH